MSKTWTRREFLRTGTAAAGGLVAAACGASSQAGPTQQSLSDIRGTTITYMVPVTLSQAAQQAAKDFKAKYGVTVNFSLQAEANPLRDKLLAEFAAHSTAVDAVDISPWWMGSFGPFLEPIQPYISNKKIVDPAFHFSDFTPNLLKLYATVHGHLLGLPSHDDNMVLWYRSDLFQDASERNSFRAKYGTDLAVPTTWNAYLQVAEHFTRPSQQLWGASIMGFKDQQLSAEWINRFRGVGGQFFKTAAGGKRGAPSIGGSAGTQAMQLLVKAGQSVAPPGYLQNSYQQAIDVFAQGRAAMFEGWSSALKTFQDPAKSHVAGKVNGALMPGGHGTGGGWLYGVSKYSKNKLAAYKWIEWLSLPRNVEASFKLDGMMPCRKSAYQQSYLLSVTPPGYLHQYQLAAKGAQPLPNQYPSDSQLEQQLENYVSLALAGSDTPSQAAQAAENSWKQIEQQSGLTA